MLLDKRIAYTVPMNLKEYLSKRGSTADLARKIAAQPQLVWQWSTGVRPVPVERCVPIERATEGAVTRKDLRPNDWAEIWPELAGTSATACVCATQSVAGQAGA